MKYILVYDESANFENIITVKRFFHKSELSDFIKENYNNENFKIIICGRLEIEFTPVKKETDFIIELTEPETKK